MCLWGGPAHRASKVGSGQAREQLVHPAEEVSLVKSLNQGAIRLRAEKSTLQQCGYRLKK